MKKLQFKLKDGRDAIIRPVTIEDAENLLNVHKQVVKEVHFLNAEPEDVAKITIEEEKQWLQRNIDSKNVCMLLCEVDGEVVGSCSVEFNDKVKTKHYGNIGIQIIADYCSHGIGTKMFEAMIQEGKRRKKTLLTLSFLEGNKRGRGLYEKMGFRIVGMIPNRICLNNEYITLYYMEKWL